VTEPVAQHVSAAGADGGYPPVIRCIDVTIAYGREVVLRGVSVDVPRGAFMPFVGSNGAGKTTLLRAIVGLIKPRSGLIETPFGTVPPGYVPQQGSIDPLYPVSLWQIVAMGLYPRLGWWRRPSPDMRDEIDRVLERFDLADHRHKTYAELSGGMKQKTLVARALVSGAEVLIMDEPTSQLDEESEIETLQLLARLSREDGKTVLFAAHHGLMHVQGLAPAMCRIDHGRAEIVEADPGRWQEHGESEVAP